jgi:hypothetical protein
VKPRTLPLMPMLNQAIEVVVVLLQVVVTVLLLLRRLQLHWTPKTLPMN